MVVGLGLACYALSRVEFDTSFVQAVPRSAPPSALRGADALQGLRSSPQAQQGWAATGLPAAAAVLVLGALGASTQRMKNTRARRVQVKVSWDKDTYGDVGDGIDRKGVVSVYSKALLDVASEKKESVLVTKDVIKVRNLFKDDEWKSGPLTMVKMEALPELEEAREMIKIMEPFESTILPKFIVYMAKKRRLKALELVCQEYVFALYSQQSIAPVLVTSAEPLTEEQKEALKEKMKVWAEASDIKLINLVNPKLVAGMTIEWGFSDPEDLNAAMNKLDLSLQGILKNSALNKGVVVQEFI